MISNLLILLLAAASGAENECNFTRDCQELRRCRNIADAGCVCNFGKCVIDGNPFFRGSECNKYSDCPCKNNKESCFCRGGFCREARWECHEAADCKKLDKCKSRDCACSGDLCESDCDTDDDCKDFHCNKALGYKCKCENSLCAYKKKSSECKSIADCIEKGKCTADKPCACTQEFCTLPWWVAESSLEINCRSDQDCEEIIANCRGDKCVCGNMKNINDWELRGTCGERTKPKQKNEEVIATVPAGYEKPENSGNKSHIKFEPVKTDTKNKEEKKKNNNDAIVFQ